MLKIFFSPSLHVNAINLGIEVTQDAVYAPEELRGVLQSMGVRTADALVAALQSFPTAFAASTGMDPDSIDTASGGALELLRPHVDPRVLHSRSIPQRRGLGAMPPRWTKMSNGS